MMKDKILIVDDEKALQMIVGCLLEDNGYEVEFADSGEECIEQAKLFSPDLILLDLEMPGIGGIATLDELQANGYDGRVIIITAYGSIGSAVEATKLGAYDYISKPFVNENLLLTIERCLQHNQMEKELTLARERLETKFNVQGFVTNNSRMKQILDTVEQVAPYDTPVLITGESGTGKDLIANAIHQHSQRKDKPFIALNCGSIPDNLIESELYGHKKGAFSGADRSKPGLVEKAHGGTLFLDEVGELSQKAQVNLLRFLETGQFYPVGGTEPHKVDVRIIAATNRALQTGVGEVEFRQDLFYRLNVINLKMPPLRERIDDIQLLIDHFLKKHGRRFDKENHYFNSKALEVLQLHPWPGNVRELENVVIGSLLIAKEIPITPSVLPIAIQLDSIKGLETAESRLSLKNMVDINQEMVEKRAIIDALEECNGNQTKAAELLQVGRATLRRKMKEYMML